MPSNKQHNTIIRQPRTPPPKPRVIDVRPDRGKANSLGKRDTAKASTVITHPHPEFHSRTVTGTPHRSARVHNRDGSNPLAAAKLGKDVRTGPSSGKPFMQHRVVDDGPIKRTHYNPGVYPGSMLSEAHELRDSNEPRRSGHTHADRMSKAANEAHSETMIDKTRRGTVKR